MLTVLKTFCFSVICSVFNLAYLHAQVCNTTLFTKSIDVGAPRGDFLIAIPGGGTIFGGRAFGASNQISVIKTTPDGNIVFNKRVEGLTNYYQVARACLTKENNVLIAVGPNLILLDTNGVFLKAAATAMTWGEHYVQDVKVDDQGNIFVLYDAFGGDGDESLLTKLSPDLSKTLWTATFGVHSDTHFKNILVDGDKIFLPGSFALWAGENIDGSILCFNSNDGSLRKQIALTIDGFTTYFHQIHKTKEGFLLKGFFHPYGVPYSIQNHVVVRLDDNLQPISASRITNFFREENLYIEPDKEGGFFGAGGSSNVRMFHCNQKDSVTWTKIRPYAGGFGIGQFTASNLNLYTVEQTSWVLIKSDLFGYTGTCDEWPFQMETVPVTPALLNKTLSSRNISLTLVPKTLSVTERSFLVREECRAQNTCNTIEIIGESGICTSSESVNFVGRRNVGCGQPVRWQVNGLKNERTAINDSTLSIFFKESGRYQVIASVPTSCEIVTDTLEVNVTVYSQGALNLGKDTSLCSGSTINLNARKGYESYQWQDGSTDSTYKVTQPGIYHVTVIDACGRSFKDTIAVLQQPSIPFEVSTDRPICAGDTIRFRAPDGFLNYSWSPAYAISATAGQAVTVNPAADTTYFVRAEERPGCFVYDTIRVNVFHAPPIRLGPDLSFCLGESYTLDAGAGFSSYTWNTGVTTQQITVRTAGQYIVTGTTDMGCKASDTLSVLNTWALPVVNLDKNPELCAGTTRTLNAGRFSTYLWQDGSTGRSLTVSGAGRYHVTVTDANGCTGSDTTGITTILPLPTGFLFADTAICSYSKIQLQPFQDYQSYLWSTGGATRNITVENPGLYWLEVEDAKGCRGRDSVVVSLKDCMSGVYIPTAFTPNRDGKNDEFRALVFGRTEKFELTVYNRWGQVIFYTADPRKGWDGKVAGLVQETSVYVWTCRYQLTGGKEVVEKGTVTIIR